LSNTAVLPQSIALTLFTLQQAIATGAKGAAAPKFLHCPLLPQKSNKQHL